MEASLHKTDLFTNPFPHISHFRFRHTWFRIVMSYGLYSWQVDRVAGERTDKREEDLEEDEEDAEVLPAAQGRGEKVAAPSFRRPFLVRLSPKL